MTVVCLVSVLMSGLEDNVVELVLKSGLQLASLTSGTKQTGKSQNKMSPSKAKAKARLARKETSRVHSTITLNGAERALKKALRLMRLPKNASRKR